MSSEFTFGDNSDKLSTFSIFFKNLVDRDLAEYQVAQTLTLSRLHTRNWSRQGDSDCSHTPGADKGNPTV